jgi:chromosomal replication initiator protein
MITLHERLTAIEHRLQSLERPKVHGTLRQVLEVVADAYCVTVEALLRPDRSQAAVLPRWMAMYLARTTLGLSLPQIGRQMGRDHSTVLHGVRRIEAMAKHDRDFAEALRALSATVIETQKRSRT